MYFCTQQACRPFTTAPTPWEPGSQMVVFGFPYELILKVQEDSSKACTFYGFSTDDELDQFEHLLVSKSAESSEPPVQAVWCECASNPLLRTVDLDRIRRLANKYGFARGYSKTRASSSLSSLDVVFASEAVQGWRCCVISIAAYNLDSDSCACRKRKNRTLWVMANSANNYARRSDVRISGESGLKVRAGTCRGLYGRFGMVCDVPHRNILCLRIEERDRRDLPLTRVSKGLQA